MKHLQSSPFKGIRGGLVALLFLLPSCNTNEPTAGTDPQTDFAKATYFETLGTNTVPNVEGDNHDLPFVMDNIRAEIVVTTDSTLDIYLYEINFSSKMPVTIDMVIPAASYTRSAKQLTISGNNITPLMGTKPFERYAVTDLNGYLTADSLVFHNAYGPYPDCTYAGKVVKKDVRN